MLFYDHVYNAKIEHYKYEWGTWGKTNKAYISCPYLKYFLANSNMENLPSCNDDVDLSLWTETGEGGIGTGLLVDDGVPDLETDWGRCKSQ